MNQKIYKLLFAHLLLSNLPYFSQYSIPIIILNLFLFILFFRRPDFIKNKTFKISILVLGATLVILEFKNFKGLLPGINLLSVFVSLKLLETQDKRDGVILVLFSFILNTVNLMVEDRLYYVIFLFMQWILSFYILSQIHSNGETTFSLKRLGKILLSAIPLTFLLFFVFPRLGLGSLSRVKAEAFKLGFTEKLNPGDVSEAVRTRDIIFRAKFLGGKRPNYQDLYWIGAYMAQNNGLVWSKNNLPRQKERSKGELFKYQLDFEYSKTAPLFYLKGSHKIKVLGSGRVNSKADGMIELTPYHGQRPRVEISKGHSIPYSINNINDYLQVKGVDDRVIKLANTLKGDNSAETISNILNYFQKNFSYTLNPGKYNSLSEFLVDRKVGFCGHFASAMGVLLRLNGIPTRILTGFMGGTYNQYGDYYIITSEDSHAWIEVYDEARGWNKVDPTAVVAKERIEFGGSEYLFALLNQLGPDYFKNKLAQGTTEKFKLVYDLFYYQLSDSFFNFDLEVQYDLFKNYIKRANPIYIMLGLSILVPILFLSIFFIFIRLIKRKDPLLELYLRCCRKRGEFPYEYEGLRDFLKRTQSGGPFERIILYYEELKYNPKVKENVSRKFIKEAKKYLT